MNSLHEVLEICLHDIEQGADVDAVLLRYPEYASELRPILEASVGAMNMAVPGPSVEVVRRNRARVLRQAAQLRAARDRAASRRMWRVSLRRVAVTLLVVAVLFVSGTNLVRAASTTVPGDSLYPVKRTWEDVLLLFTFNLQQREALEVEHENERLHELRELLAEGRSEDVEFAGLVTSQSADEWVISGVPVRISAQTEIRGQGIVLGSAVRVEGQTQGNVVVLAERIELLPPGATLPDLDDEGEGEDQMHEGEERQEYRSPAPGSGNQAPKLQESETHKPKEEASQDGSEHDNSSSDSGQENDQSGGDSEHSDSESDNHSDSDHSEEDQSSPEKDNH